MQQISEKAYAKLNLSLDIAGKRSDGFHDMRMIMQTVSLCDDLTFSLRHDGVINIQTNLHYLPCDERNIAYKVAKAFFKETHQTELGANITIEKRIPVCAGMGGGSSDGAAVLRGLNKLTGKKLSRFELERLSADIGADIPFCIAGGTQLAEGKGEILRDLPPLPDCKIVICKPEFSVSTPELFGKIDSAHIKYRPDTRGMISALNEESLSDVSRRMFNVFEDALGREKNIVNSIKSTMLDFGALGTAMTGTGSAVFGVFTNEDAAKKAKYALNENCGNSFIAVPIPQIEI